MATFERLPPNYERLDVALRAIGYSFENAVADIVDNSIDAKAENILIRIVEGQEGQLDLLIQDDGRGMDPKTLKEAMRFGTDVNQELKRLGKFGLGLKLASLSQARELKVITLSRGTLSGRAWLEDGIRKGFQNSVLEEKESKIILSKMLPDKPFRKSGTVVIWNRLYRVGQNHNNISELAQRLLDRLRKHLSLSFHRFLSSDDLRIALDVFDRDTSRPGLPLDLKSLDPFGYLSSGFEGFPTKMFLSGQYEEKLILKAHIWPPNSDAPEYKLPGGANSRQGFYFYRNDRLIQGGGWNGIRESEPHSSLARIEIDMAADFDIEVSLDVKKTEIQLPPPLVTAILAAKARNGTDFKKYLKFADLAYRKRAKVGSEVPIVPDEGLPAKLVQFMKGELLRTKSTKSRKVSFQWGKLDDDRFLEIDRDKDVIILNKVFRQKLQHGLSGSSTDIPVLKCLIFLLLKDTFYRERESEKLREATDRLNRILLKAIRFERGMA